MRYIVIGSVLAAAWLVLSIVMLTDLADSLMAAAIASVIVAAPVSLALVLHKWIRTSRAYLLDLTAMVYVGAMVWVYIDVQLFHPDPQGAIAFVFYPVVAITIILVEAIVLQLWSRRSTRDSQ